MNAYEIMTQKPACCQAGTSLQRVAEMMVARHCGAIPVVKENNTPIGLVTDRDIVCRNVAKGINPLKRTAGDCMTSPALTVTEETNINECSRLMEENQIRRLIVVDSQGRCTGIIAQADLSRVLPEDEIAEIERLVTEPTEEASRIVH